MRFPRVNFQSRKMPNRVTLIMPAKTAVPSVRRISAPAPSAMTSVQFAVV
jgi:hypothetical protein